MRIAKNGATVRIYYTGTLKNGTVFEHAPEGDPLEFTLGKGEVVPGLDKAVRGMAVGEEKTVELPPEEAYGTHKNSLRSSFSREEFPTSLLLREGQRYQAALSDGRVRNFTVTKMTEASVTIDENHPLAGEVLTYEIKLVGTS